MKSHQVAQGFIQSSLENLQGGGQQNLYRISVLPLEYPHSEKVSPYMQSEPLMFRLMPNFSHSST